MKKIQLLASLFFALLTIAVLTGKIQENVHFQNTAAEIVLACISATMSILYLLAALEKREPIQPPYVLGPKDYRERFEEGI